MTLLGGGGSDVMDGGLGADSMAGGIGDDWYFLDNSGDLTVELAGQGYDRVSSAISWTRGAQIERLSLLGMADLNATGNTLVNRLDGNAGANRLDVGEENDTLYGLGGADTLRGGAGDNAMDGGEGADSMAGGLGKEGYFVDSPGDLTIELAGQGYDRVSASISWTLSAEIERLSLLGAGKLDGTGNALANRLDGNDGANELEGGAGNDTIYGGGGNDTIRGGADHDRIIDGLGDDRMEGGDGNDLYDVDSPGDVIVEAANAGTDPVYLFVGSFTMSANLENFYFKGAGNVNVTGSAVANQIIAGTGNETLSGGDGNDALTGGLGADLMTGGQGSDINRLLRGKVDGETITDFDGGGAALRDRFVFIGYGKSGVSLVALGDGDWQITSADGLTTEVFHLTGVNSMFSNNYTFG